MGACNGKSETSASTEPNKSESAEANETEKTKSIGSEEPPNTDDIQQDGVCKHRSHDLVCLSWGESMLSFMIGHHWVSKNTFKSRINFDQIDVLFLCNIEMAHEDCAHSFFFAIDLKTGSLFFSS